jgi:hypothetical protein
MYSKSKIAHLFILNIQAHEEWFSILFFSNVSNIVLFVICLYKEKSLFFSNIYQKIGVVAILFIS